jgi:hypothetical protein
MGTRSYRRRAQRRGRRLEEFTVAERAKVFVVDQNEIDRYARAITRIAERGHPAGSAELARAVNTYGTAFQFLVMRRGADYGRALGMAAGDLALAQAGHPDNLAGLVSGDIADIHERVCVAEEEALAREADEGNNRD